MILLKMLATHTNVFIPSINVFLSNVQTWDSRSQISVVNSHVLLCVVQGYYDCCKFEFGWSTAKNSLNMSNMSHIVYGNLITLFVLKKKKLTIHH